MAAKKAAEVIAKEGIDFKICPHNNQVNIITTRNGNTLITCLALFDYFNSGRQNRNGCRLLSHGGCPFELHDKLVSS